MTRSTTIPNLSDLPIPIAIIVAAFWFYQQSTAANAKQIVTLIDSFNKEYGALFKSYEALVQMAFEDRQAARDRWIERDRLLNERLQLNTTELAQNKSETHQIRNLMQTVAATIELIAREILPGRSTRRKPSGSDD